MIAKSKIRLRPAKTLIQQAKAVGENDKQAQVAKLGQTWHQMFDIMQTEHRQTVVSLYDKLGEESNKWSMEKSIEVISGCFLRLIDKNGFDDHSEHEDSEFLSEILSGSPFEMLNDRIVSSITEAVKRSRPPKIDREQSLAFFETAFENLLLNKKGKLPSFAHEDEEGKVFYCMDHICQAIDKLDRIHKVLEMGINYHIEALRIIDDRADIHELSPMIIQSNIKIDGGALLKGYMPHPDRINHPTLWH